jgi:hypothetical protein
MIHLYLFGLLLCSVALVALLFGQRYIKSDLLFVLRISLGLGLIGFGTLAAIQNYQRDAQIAKRQQESANIQIRLDKFKLRQADLKSRFDALAAEEAKAPHDPVVQKDLASQRLALMRESATSKAELDDIQKELDANRQ